MDDGHDLDDPTLIDWGARQRNALVPFEVRCGYPINPRMQPTRGELWRWGPNHTADAGVTATTVGGDRWLLMIQRGCGGWALPGGFAEDGEDAATTAVRETAEEAGLVVPASVRPVLLQPRIVDDPRCTPWAWIVTVPVRLDLGVVGALPEVKAGSDAVAAGWNRADDYLALSTWLDVCGRRMFKPHRGMLRELLG